MANRYIICPGYNPTCYWIEKHSSEYGFQGYLHRNGEWSPVIEHSESKDIKIHSFETAAMKNRNGRNTSIYNSYRWALASLKKIAPNIVETESHNTMKPAKRAKSIYDSRYFFEQS